MENGNMSVAMDVLAFRRMISPIILQVLFWGGIGGTLYGTYVLIALGHWAWPLPLIFGALAVRVIFEMAILAFRNFDCLCQIRDQLRQI
jgi:hypothetical protein